MTGAEILRETADWIDAWADDTPVGPWGYEGPGYDLEWNVYDANGVNIANRVAGSFCARWISAWSPGMGRLVAEFLRALADDAEEVPVDARAVALAEVIRVALGSPLPRSE